MDGSRWPAVWTRRVDPLDLGWICAGSGLDLGSGPGSGSGPIQITDPHTTALATQIRNSRAVTPSGHILDPFFYHY